MSYWLLAKYQLELSIARHRLPFENTICSPLARIEKRPDSSSDDCARTVNTEISSKAAQINRPFNVSLFLLIILPFYILIPSESDDSYRISVQNYDIFCTYANLFAIFRSQNRYFMLKTCICAQKAVSLHSEIIGIG